LCGFWTVIVLAADDEKIEFGELDEEGRWKALGFISKSTIQKCPHLILLPEHYRDDDTCRCDDYEHKEMHEWGYQWDEEQKRWV